MLKDIFLGGPIFFMVTCELLQSVAFCPDNKRTSKGRILKLMFALVIISIIILLDKTFVDFNTASTAFEAPFCFLAAYLYAVAALRIPKAEAVYCTVWTYIMTEIATQIIMPLTDMISRGTPEITFWVRYLLVFILSLGIFYGFSRHILARELQSNRHYIINRQKLFFSAAIVAFYLLTANYQFIFWLLGYEPESGSNIITLFRLIVGICCLSVLFMQNSMEKKQQVELEFDLMQQLWHRQQEQFQLSQENIDLINRKCHDLKHQMSALRQLKDTAEIDKQLGEMEHSVMIYDSVVKTGNPVLDTVLTEKSLYCEEHQIQMTCMADGGKLDFIDQVDLYTIFGNALDNAIESVSKLNDPKKRIIQVVVFNEKDLLMIRVGNYYEGKLRLENGLPMTTKQDKDYHGFGLKSIRFTAEKYGGGISAQIKDQYFFLHVLLPVPAK